MAARRDGTKVLENTSGPLSDSDFRHESDLKNCLLEREGKMEGSGERERQTQRQRQISCPLVVHSTNGCSNQDWTRPGSESVAGNSESPTWVEGPKYLNHHLLPPRIHSSRKSEVRVELGLEPRHSFMGCGHLKW